MRIAVTGHLGTIGKPLVKALRHQGHEVIGIDYRHNADGLRADIGDYRQISDALKMADAKVVYHLAAEFGRYNGEDYTEQLWRTNCTGTKNMLRVQRDLGFKMIFASSSEVYGERKDQLLHEYLDLSPFFLSNDYAISKLVNEGQIQNARKQWGNQVMTLRFFNAYGPGEFYHAYRSVVCLFAYRALKGIPYNVYEGYYRVFQYVDDLIATLVSATPNFKDGMTANVAGTEYCSVRQLHEEICKWEPQAERLATFLPEEAHNVVSKRPAIEIAQRVLGHNPRVTLAEGVPQTLDWLRHVYQL
jgi:dTDP-glucose 4,6-dehydratase